MTVGKNVLSWTYDEDWDLLSLDAREALERVLADEEVDVAGALDLFESTVGDVEDEASLRRAAWSLGLSAGAPPDGNSWVQWARWYRRRLQQVLEDPSTVLRRGELDLDECRKSTASVDTTAQSRRGAVVASCAARDPEVRRWLADGSAGQRLYLVGDTGALVGQVGRVTSYFKGLGLPDTWEVTRADVTDCRPTTWAGVLLRRTAPGAHHAEVVDVHAVEAEADGRGASWRSAFPHLCAGFGGYLGEATMGVWPWIDQLCLLQGEEEPWLLRFADEGEELLRLPDTELAAACAALGSRVRVGHLRLWLTWMFWRAREFDWS